MSKIIFTKVWFSDFLRKMVPKWGFISFMAHLSFTCHMKHNFCCIELKQHKGLKLLKHLFIHLFNSFIYYTAALLGLDFGVVVLLWIWWYFSGCIFMIVPLESCFSKRNTRYINIFPSTHLTNHMCILKH